MENNEYANDILVTVGIACYNQGSVLPATIASVLQQSYPAIEIIISDDCSTDDTEKSVIPFLADKRLKYSKNQRNIGRVANYRKLLYEHARGKWFINIDGDDELVDNNFISDAVKYILADQSIVMVCAACKRLINGKVDYIIQSSYKEEMVKIDGKSFFLNFATGLSWIAHLTTLYNVDKAKSIDFYNVDIISADYESLFRLCLLGKIVSIQRVAGIWNIHGQNESIKNNSNSKGIINNFIFIENVAAFAGNYLSKRELQIWHSTMLKKELNNQYAMLLLHRPKNWIRSVYIIFKKYPFVSLKISPRLLFRALKTIYRTN